jgi:hypothetical protein
MEIEANVVASRSAPRTSFQQHSGRWVRLLTPVSIAFVTAAAALAQPAPTATPTPTAASSDSRVPLNRILSMEINAIDAKRFATLFTATRGAPTADQLRASYLEGAGRGVQVFTPDRIQNPANLAAAVARDSARYAYAIRTCLPLVEALTLEMRSVYLAYLGLMPARRVPDVFVVFGAGNSGGTASMTAQVLGLEVMCGPGTTPDQFRSAMRRIFAHETVHSFQNPAPSAAIYGVDPLLFSALREGVPDYLAMLTSGAQPSAEREAWARSREREIWRDFTADRATVKAGRVGDWDLNPTATAAAKRWFGNYRSAPAGWPDELGYWVGMQIARAYVERSPDRAAAIEALIALKDPLAILEASAYGREWTAPR